MRRANIWRELMDLPAKTKKVRGSIETINIQVMRHGMLVANVYGLKSAHIVVVQTVVEGVLVRELGIEQATQELGENRLHDDMVSVICIFLLK
jgi:hypothetical protein